MTRRLLRPFLFLAACGLSHGAEAAQPPITGDALPGFEAADAAMRILMEKHGSPGGQLAVTYHGRLVLSRGYGIADRETAAPVRPDSLSRIASLSKLLTAVAVLTLVEDGKLDLDARAFALLPDLTPATKKKPDPRLADITVRQLLQHTGGWDRAVSGDPMFKPALIASATGTTAPPNVETIVRYMLTEPLDTAPGTHYAYSNFGYAVLGRIVEKISGRPYADYVRTRIFAPLGITRAFLGRTAWDRRDPAELHYSEVPGAKTVRSVFPDISSLVPSPYGGFYLEAMDAHGQWVMRAVDYVRLLAALDGSRSPALLSPSSIALLTDRPAPPVSVGAAAYYGFGTQVRPIRGRSGTGANWWHGGSLPGTITYSVRLADGWSWVAFFNTRPAGGDFSGDIDRSINAALHTITPPASGDLFPSSSAPSP